MVQTYYCPALHNIIQKHTKLCVFTPFPFVRLVLAETVTMPLAKGRSPRGAAKLYTGLIGPGQPTRLFSPLQKPLNPSKLMIGNLPFLCPRIEKSNILH